MLVLVLLGDGCPLSLTGLNVDHGEAENLPAPKLTWGNDAFLLEPPQSLRRDTPAGLKLAGGQEGLSFPLCQGVGWSLSGCFHRMLQMERFGL